MKEHISKDKIVQNRLNIRKNEIITGDTYFQFDEFHDKEYEFYNIGQAYSFDLVPEHEEGNLLTTTLYLEEE